MKKACVVLIPLILLSCHVLKNNTYIMHYTEVNAPEALENKLDLGEKTYPKVVELESSDACVEEYERLKAEGYRLLGYSLFHHEGKMSHGVALEAGIKLGAHRILLARERSHSGSLNPEKEDAFRKFKNQPMIEALLTDGEQPSKNSSKSYSHNALFLIQCAQEKE